MEANKTETEQKKDVPVKKENKFLKFIFRHKIIVILLLVLIGVFIWGTLKIGRMERDFVMQKDQIVHDYELRMDSLNLTKMELVSSVFSWAIRSEMTRENMEQVNQFFLNFIKVPNVEKVQLISYNNSSVLISTDKKDEGQVVTDNTILQSDTIRSYKTDSTHSKIITPIMGLNNRIATLVIEIKK